VKSISIDPGEMNTRMHADAIPSADPATLADPRVIAARIAALVARPEALVNGARLEASSLPEAS
jgi:hypothetical protein